MKQNKGFGVIAVLVVFLILAGIGGAVVYQKNKTEVPVTETIPSQAAENEVQKDESVPPKSKTPSEVKAIISASSNLDFKNNPDLTDHQKEMIQEGIDLMESIQHQTGIVATAEEKKIYTEASINAAIAASEAGIKAEMKQNIPPTAEIYFDNSTPISSYGVSSTENFCTNTSLRARITSINQFTKIKVICTVSSGYPSKTYTIIAPSVANKGQYYCTDPKNLGVLIQLSAGYKAGEKCK